jgi:hypothetical protein
MQSCEYMKVSGPQKTKLLTLKKIMFFKNYDNYPMERLSYILQSGYQLPLSYKNVSKNDAIMQHRSDDPIVCPVKIWVNIVRRISKHPNST